MRRHPVPGDVDAAADPHVLVAEHMIEKLFECRDPPGPADQACVQSHRQHFRRIQSGRIAFAVQHIEREELFHRLGWFHIRVRAEHAPSFIVHRARSALRQRGWR